MIEDSTKCSFIFTIGQRPNYIKVIESKIVGKDPKVTVGLFLYYEIHRLKTFIVKIIRDQKFVHVCGDLVRF